MRKAKNGGLWKALAILAAFGLALVLTGCPSPATFPDEPSPVTSVRVVPDPENHGMVLDGDTGTLNYLITIVGEGVFPIRLHEDVVVAQECGAPLPESITLNPGQVTAPGVASPLSFSIDRLAPASFSLVVSVHGVASAPFNLVVGTIAAVDVAPAPNPGMAVAGYGGALNYLIRIDGAGVFPVDFQDLDVRLANQDRDPLPAGISVNPGAVEATGQYFPLSISAERPDEATYSLVVSLHGIESAPFDLVVSGDSFAARLALLHILGLPEGESEATVETVSPYEGILPQELYFDGREINIILVGEPGDTLYIENPGTMFTIGAGVTLTLRDIILRGVEDNTEGTLVVVGSGGTLVMDTGSVITGNFNTNPSPLIVYQGGGLRVEAGGTFTMLDGEITYNDSEWGGGVFVMGGTFVMKDGQIRDNVAAQGAGVRTHLAGSVFSMYGGEILGNVGLQGAGLNVATGTTFNMHGGAISGNLAEAITDGAVLGGGMLNNGTVNMYGGEISDNEANQGGGVDNRGTFNMHEGAIISGNTAVEGGGQALGGGVINSATFNMRGGVFSGNSSVESGGGIINFGYFRISNGVLYGSDEPESANRAPSGPVLNSQPNATSQHGSFANGAFTPQGDLASTGLTIEVEEGELIRPTAGPSSLGASLDFNPRGALSGNLFRERAAAPRELDLALALRMLE